MDQQGNGQEHNGMGSLSKVKDIKIQARRSRSNMSGSANGRHPERHNVSNDHDENVDYSNTQDFPYDGTCEDEFSVELASVADEQKDEIDSPMSQASQASCNSTVSGTSWNSNQKTIAGLGMDEAGSQEVLGPYKRVGSVQALEAVPTEYRDYTNNRESHSTANVSYAGSPSLSSNQAAHDSLYADLSSISDRDLQVPEGLVKADGFDCEFDDGRASSRSSPSGSFQVENEMSKLKLDGPTHEVRE